MKQFSILLIPIILASCSSMDTIDLPPTLNGEVSSSSDGSSSSYSVVEGQEFEGTNVFVDARDGNRYKYEIYNSRIWMSENLNYSRGGKLGYCYRTNASTTNIAEAINELGTAGANGSGCESPYGRHYTWQVAMDGNSSQGLCPDGWHIPSRAEWQTIKNERTGSGTTATQEPKKMSSSFYVYAGNFNLNAEWPPFGWKGRAAEGLCWSSTASGDEVGFFFMGGGGDAGDDNIVSGPASSSMDYFSIRCILETGFMADCKGIKFNPVTSYCLDGIVVPRGGW